MATVEQSSNLYNLGDTAIVSKLGVFLRQIRLELNLTQEKLTVTAGLNNSIILH